MICTFNPRGGTCSPLSITIAVNATFGNNLPIPTLTGARFLGWYNFDLFGQSAVTPSTKVTQNQNFTLYARWQSVTTSAERIIIKPRRGDWANIDLQANELGFVKDQNLFAMADPQGVSKLAGGLGLKVYDSTAVLKVDQTLAQGNKVLFVKSSSEIQILQITGKDSTGWIWAANPTTIAPAADASEAIRQILGDYYKKSEVQTYVTNQFSLKWKSGGTWPAAGLESYLSTNYVTLTTTQTISGAKTFTSSLILSKSNPELTAKHIGVTKGTAPSSDAHLCSFRGQDKDGADILRILGYVMNTSGDTRFIFRHYYNVAGSTSTKDILSTKLSKDGATGEVVVASPAVLKFPGAEGTTLTLSGTLTVANMETTTYDTRSATIKMVKDWVASELAKLSTTIAETYQKKLTVSGTQLVVPQ